MVAETGRYRSSSGLSSRYQSSTVRSAGKYGSTYSAYSSHNGSSYNAGSGGVVDASGAPVFGRIRITQSVERDARGGDVGGRYIGTGGGITQPIPHSSRRFSLSTDLILPGAKPLDLTASGARALQQSSSYVYPRRASIASSTLRPHAYVSHRLHTMDDVGDSNSLYLDGTYSDSYPDYHQYGGTSVGVSLVSPRRSFRASSVSKYESQNSAGILTRESSISQYEEQTGRAPSISRYESQTSLGRSSPSVPRYDSQSSIGRASSVSRYEVQPSFARASSVSRYESQSSGGRLLRSASVSRYERQTAAEDLHSDYYPSARATSVARSEQLFDHTIGTSGSTSTVDDDEAYELRRQLRALRNHQIRAGSVARHDRPQPERVVHAPETPHVVRPRSLSISSHRDSRRRNRVATVHTVSQTANPPIITGYPEPTLYSAKVFQTKTVHTPEGGTRANIAVSNTEMGFVDNRDDITSYVLKPGERFLPTDVSVTILPSGKKAVTYTKFSQKGHGDQRTANEEIDKIIHKTKSLQDSMHTLEDFVKRNRSLFPEDIIIYQKIVFYLLSEEELIKMGERPDAEIYGLKIRERLVAPIGTDVASILKRFYARHKEVDVEYEHPEVIRRQRKLTEAGVEFKIPPKGKRFDDEFDLESPGQVPHGWLPARLSRSSDNALYIEEEDPTRRRDWVARSPKIQRPSAPEFTHRLRRQRAVIGQSVRLSCSVSAFPEADVTWYRGKQEIAENGRFTIKNHCGLCTLAISDVNADDATLYTARAVNSEGEATTTALLDVFDLLESVASKQAPRKRSSEPAAVGPAAVGPAAAAGRRPFFLLEARNMWADVGERAVFEVQAAGKPLPSFTWVKDSNPVIEDDHIQIVSDGYGNCKLVVREIRGTDFGTYRCLAHNDDGLVESIASLFCVGNESVRPGQALKNELRSTAGQYRGRKPQFVHLPPSRIDVTEGEPLTMQCAVDGDPKPLVTWYKGVRELTYTGRHRVLEERNNCYVMQLKSTLATDSGEYTVTAHNLCGLVEFIVYVNVLPGEQSLEDFDANWKRPNLTPVEYELVTKTRQGKMPPIFVKKLPREKRMNVGTSLKLDCYIEESKPREYLVDVDIVLKDSNKGDALPKTFDKKRKLKKEDISTGEVEAARTDKVLNDNYEAFSHDGGERAADGGRRISPEHTAVFSFKPEGTSEAETIPAVEEAGIEKLAKNLAQEISQSAVETIQRQEATNSMHAEDQRRPETESTEHATPAEHRKTKEEELAQLGKKKSEETEERTVEFEKVRPTDQQPIASTGRVNIEDQKKTKEAEEEEEEEEEASSSESKLSSSESIEGTD